jgi:hypothetical protein
MKYSALELSRHLVVTPFFESRKPTLHRTVADVMSPEVYVIDPMGGVYDAAALMVAAHVGRLPVVTDRGDVVGIVTLTDILYRCKVTGTLVKEVMTAPVATIAPDEIARHHHPERHHLRAGALGAGPDLEEFRILAHRPVLRDASLDQLKGRQAHQVFEVVVEGVTERPGRR